jgi:uncharacterized membrane protein YjgN (DUF898 family)
LPAWLTIYALFFILSGLAFYLMRGLPHAAFNNAYTGSYNSLNYSQVPDPKVFAALGLFVLLLLPVSLFAYFYFIRFCIEGISFKGSNLQFKGTLAGFAGRILLGLVLSVFTLFFYVPWFISSMVSFFVDNTSLDGEKFEFKGQGLILLGIILVTLVVPFIVFFMLSFNLVLLMAKGNFLYRMLFNILEVMVIAPYIYFIHQWYVNVKFKEYIIEWRTEAGPSIFKIMQEYFLMMITFYIYYPMAMVRLYGYFINRTVADNGHNVKQFGFDSTDLDDFIFIWKEILLTIITLGIYLPWAICKVNKRILDKTYLESFDEPAAVAG